MAPLNWLILFLFFSIIFILFNTINFYSFLYKSKSEKNNKKSLNFNWKW
uniref:ATP synthase complex subunit 8 n=1 Tax=Demonax pseudonotabilis TaxID=2992285 RepID=A0A9E8AC87_9CUCU|nr:ATP synthase F0 subunit 8 [Demonax pseudonotabilis]UYX61161.1 ATP synthase F0 subunit 8 [Demonax pseudonotabilis]